MWAIVGWTILWIVVAVVVILAVVSVLVVPAFLWDRFVVAGDSSSTVVANEVTIYRAKPVRSTLWGYDPIYWVQYSPKHRSQKYVSPCLPQVRRAYVVDPGIFARRNQFEPMFPVIERDYDIYTLEYGGLRYDRERSALWVAQFVEKLLDTYDEVVYDGISHGGQHAAYVCQALGKRAKELSLVILHDAPWGAQTMKDLPNFAAGLFMFTAGGATNLVFSPVMKVMTSKLPKPENVLLPSPKNLKMLTGRTTMSSDEYFEWVKQNAKRNLSGHKFAMFYSETGDMIRAGREGLPLDAFNGVPVVYIRYVKRNDTVVQPEASKEYSLRMDGKLTVLSVEGTHAGFAENYDDNVRKLREALAKRKVNNK